MRGPCVEQPRAPRSDQQIADDLDPPHRVAHGLRGRAKQRRRDADDHNGDSAVPARRQTRVDRQRRRILKSRRSPVQDLQPPWPGHGRHGDLVRPGANDARLRSCGDSYLRLPPRWYRRWSPLWSSASRPALLGATAKTHEQRGVVVEIVSYLLIAAMARAALHHRPAS